MTVASARVYPVMVQATVEYVASKTVWKVGSATLTTVVSRIDMMAPSTTTPAIFSTVASSLSLPGGAWAVGDVMRVAPDVGVAVSQRDGGRRVLENVR